MTVKVDLGMPSSSLQQPADRGARYPRRTPKRRSGLEGASNPGISIMRASHTQEYKLTSFAVWWRRLEHDEKEFYKDVRREETNGKRKMTKGEGN